MKKVFKAIGSFFAKIWNWIKETAWIQPLLVVGIIFGIIFSIPSISKGIKDLSENSGKYSFINKNDISAEDFLKYEEEGKLTSAYGDKFLLILVGEDCNACTTAEKGIKYFVNEYYEKNSSHEKPVVKFMYAYDTEFDYNETDKDYKDVPHYYQWFENNVDALQIVNGLTTEECEEVSDQDFSDDLANGETPTPTLVLYENGEIVDVYFGIDGTEKIVIAEFISDFYYHEGTFEKNVTRK